MKQSGRHKATRFLHAKNDKDILASWKSDLNEILRIFNLNVCSVRHRFPSLIIPFSDRVSCEYPCHGCRHASKHVENGRSRRQSKSGGK